MSALLSHFFGHTISAGFIFSVYCLFVIFSLSILLAVLAVLAFLVSVAQGRRRITNTKGLYYWWLRAAYPQKLILLERLETAVCEIVLKNPAIVEEPVFLEAITGMSEQLLAEASEQRYPLSRREVSRAAFKGICRANDSLRAEAFLKGSPVRQAQG